ncbi:MAG: hypothetical protein IJW49_09550 [Clostridia bacterium]|nr:hypothetical protein [Clostridia bacterium]
MNSLKINAGKTRMVAHRGLSGLERENTCAAFLAAANRSYFGIETDVHEAADGRFVIIHDETTKRITNGEIDINIEKNAYDAYRDLVLPDIDGSKTRTDLHIPLLAEYIGICKKYEKICVLEVKNPFSEDALSRMVEEIASLGYLERVIFISFDWNNCVTLRRLLPNQQIQWLTGEPIDDAMIQKLVDNKLDLDIHFAQLNRETVSKLHAAGITVNCWTCDSPEKAYKLVDMGVDMITSNILE